MDKRNVSSESNKYNLLIMSQIGFCLSLLIVYIFHRCCSNRIKKTLPINLDFVYNTECPICFNLLTLPIKSECGHAFCIDCLYTYWKKKSWNNLCPLCREPIKNLKLIENKDHKYLESTKKLLLHKIKKMSSTSRIKYVYYCVPIMLCLLLWAWMTADTVLSFKK